METNVSLLEGLPIPALPLQSIITEDCQLCSDAVRSNRACMCLVWTVCISEYTPGSPAICRQVNGDIPSRSEFQNLWMSYIKVHLVSGQPTTWQNLDLPLQEGSSSSNTSIPLCAPAICGLKLHRVPSSVKASRIEFIFRRAFNRLREAKELNTGIPYPLLVQYRVTCVSSSFKKNINKRFFKNSLQIPQASVLGTSYSINSDFWRSNTRISLNNQGGLPSTIPFPCYTNRTFTKTTRY